MEEVKRSQSVENRSGFNLRGRHLLLTYPKNEGNKNKLMEMLLAKLESKDVLYAVCAEENHEDGSPHLHAYVQLKSQTNFKNANCLDFNGKHGDYKVAVKPDAARNYVMKGNNYVEFGEYTDPKDLKKKTQDLNRQEKNKLILETPTVNLVDDGTIAVTQIQLVEKSKNLYQQLNHPASDKIIQRECIWIYGKPRTGKSTYVRNVEDSLYEKPQNKWWCNYKHQPAIIIDDLDTHGGCLGHYIKIWADNFRFNGEYKGGNIEPTYKKMYITSNYLPENLFRDRVEAEAIRKRFQIKTIDSEYKLQDYFYDSDSIQYIELEQKKEKKRERSRDNSPVHSSKHDALAARVNILEFELKEARRIKVEAVTTREETYKNQLYTVQQELKELQRLLKEKDELIKKLQSKE